MPSIDFKLSPIEAIQLLELLQKPSEDFWQNYWSKDIVPAPQGREAINCGPIENIAVVVDTATGSPTFTVGFEPGAPILAVEFSFDGPTIVTLILALYHAADKFRWIETSRVIKLQRGKTH